MRPHSISAFFYDPTCWHRYFPRIVLVEFRSITDDALRLERAQLTEWKYCRKDHKVGMPVTKSNVPLTNSRLYDLSANRNFPERWNVRNWWNRASVWLFLLTYVWPHYLQTLSCAVTRAISRIPSLPSVMNQIRSSPKFASEFVLKDHTRTNPTTLEISDIFPLDSYETLLQFETDSRPLTIVPFSNFLTSS